MISSRICKSVRPCIKVERKWDYAFRREPGKLEEGVAEINVRFRERGGQEHYTVHFSLLFSHTDRGLRREPAIAAQMGFEK